MIAAKIASQDAFASPSNISVFSLKKTGLDTSAYPVPIVRFKTTTCLAFQASMTGILQSCGADGQKHYTHAREWVEEFGRSLTPF